jgi:hypothetical protein
LGAATHTITTVEMSLGQAAYFDYYVQSGTTLRSGVVTCVWNGTNVEFTDTSTNDLGGSTAAVVLSVDVSGTTVRLRAAIASGTWTIKTGTRII